MKNKFKYKLEDKNLLVDIATEALKYKIDKLPFYTGEIKNSESNLEAYLEDIKKEISIFEEIYFDGYMLLLYDMVKVSREMGIYIACFGSVQYSLVAYLLDITEHYAFNRWQKFVNFTAFEKRPTIHIAASSYRMGEIMDYLEDKYSSQTKVIEYAKKLEFQDALTLVFHDLEIDTTTRHSKIDVENLGLEVLEADLNTSSTEATISPDNKFCLGLESLGLGDVLVERILEEREEIVFESFEELLQRVPLLQQLDKDRLKILADNRAFLKR